METSVPKKVNPCGLTVFWVPIAATNAGISINIEDLKTLDVTKSFIKVANSEINEVSKQWQQGLISDTECIE